MAQQKLNPKDVVMVREHDDGQISIDVLAPKTKVKPVPSEIFFEHPSGKVGISENFVTSAAKLVKALEKIEPKSVLLSPKARLLLATMAPQFGYK